MDSTQCDGYCLTQEAYIHIYIDIYIYISPWCAHGLGYFAYYAAYHPGLYLGLEEAYNAYQNVQLQHSLESSQKDGGVEVGLSSSNPNQVMPMRQAD